MKVMAAWSGNKVSFQAEIGQHRLVMDTKPPIGADLGPSPKQLMLEAICGCTGIDVAMHIRKKRLPVSALTITATAEQTTTTPAVFQSVALRFEFTGEGLDPQEAVEGVRLSQTRYCGVTAMMVKHCPVDYEVIVNGDLAGGGTAQFDAH